MTRLNILGTRISATSYEEVVALVEGWLASSDRASQAGARYICVTSVHGVITARHDPEFRRILNDADLATPDGMPLVWALRSLGITSQPRVYGPTLMLRLCEAAAQSGRRVFLYGSHPEVIGMLSERLRTQYPQLMIVGSYSPPFRPLTAEESFVVQRMICESRAELIFVGLSTPKQEKWMAAQRQAFPGKVLIGVGAAFDMHAGRVKQAPSAMQRAGLEWLFRLFMEPGRLWKRYLLITPQFVPLWLMQRLGFLKYDPA